MLLAYGTADNVVRPGNSERLAAKLRSFGSPVTVKSYPGIGHIGDHPVAGAGIARADNAAPGHVGFHTVHCARLREITGAV